jgi:hypothetical protein
MTGAGLAARDYFLRGTEFMPRSPVWDSLKLALTTSLGSAACAGLLLAVIRTLRALVEARRSGDDERNRGLEILRCLALCLLSLLEGIAKFMSRYALIYCSVWGVPYREGCRRWAELECTKFIDVLIDGSIIRNAIGMNGIVWLIGTGFVAWALAGAADAAAQAVVVVAVVIAGLMWFIVTEPIQVMVDTLFVCFAEEPERLRVTDPALFDRLEAGYREWLGKRLGRIVN